MAGEIPDLDVARAIGRLEGTVEQGFLDLGRRMKSLETSFSPWPEKLVQLEHRVEDLEASWSASRKADARVEDARATERRWAWGRVITILAAIVTAAAAIYSRMRAG